MLRQLHVVHKISQRLQLISGVKHICAPQAW